MKIIIYIFDFETEAKPGNMGIFLPYCAIYKFCDSCMNDYNRKLEYQCCTFFEGLNTINEFGNYFVEKANSMTKSRWFVYNGSKFDIFLLCYIVCVKKLIPKVIMNGFRIINIQYRNVSVLDSIEKYCEYAWIE